MFIYLFLWNELFSIQLYYDLTGAVNGYLISI